MYVGSFMLANARHWINIKGLGVSSRKKKTALQRAIGDMLFDAPAQARAPMPLFPEQPQYDEYDAPPPSLSNAKRQPVQKKVEEQKPNPARTVYLEDSIDAEMLVAAADAPFKQRAAQPMPQIRSKPKQTLLFAARSAARFNANVAPPALVPNTPMSRGPDGEVIMFWTDAHEVRVNGGQHLYFLGGRGERQTCTTVSAPAGFRHASWPRHGSYSQARARRACTRH